MSQQIEQENPLVEGVIWKQLMRFFFPILLGTLFQQLYNTADALIVGRTLGENALAAVGGSAGMIASTAVTFFFELSSGASIIASQMMGARDRKQINDSIHTIYAFSIVAGICVSALGILGADQLLSWLKTPATLLADSKLYLRIYFAGIVFVMIYNTGASLLRALGDAKSAFVYLIICCLVNIVLDFVLIVFFHMGVDGAAIATVLSQGISAVLVTIRLLRFRQACDFRLRHIRILPAMLKKQLLLGLPAGAQASVYCVFNIVAMAVLNGFGETTVASWTAYGKFDCLFWMISGAMGITTMTFVGQNFGAGKHDRIKKAVGIMSAAYLLVAVTMSVLLATFRTTLFGIFVQSEEAISIGCKMLLMISPFFFINVFIEIFSGALRGVGDTFGSMLISLFGTSVFGVLYLTLLFPHYPTLTTLCIMFPISWVLTGGMYMLYYPYRMKRLSKP